MEQEFIAVLTALEQTFRVLWQEVMLVEGEFLKDQVSWVVQRIESSQSGRVLWFLIAALILAGVICVLSIGIVIYEAVTIPRKRSHFRVMPAVDISEWNTQSNTQTKLKETIDWAQKVAPRNVIGKLKAGRINAAEKALIAERANRPDDVGLIMYLLACRAMRNDAAAYHSLIEEVFPDGLKADREVCRHAAEIGRLLAKDKYPVEEIPQPETAFEVAAELIGDTLGPITEFGSVQTLLDLIRVYFEMHDIAEIRHLIVEVLVCGTVAERRQALEYAKLINRKS